MTKMLFLISALALAPYAHADSQQAGADRLMRGGDSKIKNYDRQALTREIDETLSLMEELCRQLKLATKAEADEVWASGGRDFKLQSGQVNDSRKACAYLLGALDLEGAGKDASDESKALREKARDLMRDHHKKKTESYVRDLRNWLTVSEGELRRINEKREAKP